MKMEHITWCFTHYNFRAIIAGLLLSVVCLFPYAAEAKELSSAQSQENQTIESLPVEELSEEERNRIWSQLNVICKENEELTAPLCSFDVSSDGAVILLTRNNQICLFRDAGEGVQYRFSFTWDGDAGVAWENKNICIYLVRGDLLVEISPDGRLLKISRLLKLDYDVQKQIEGIFFRTSINDTGGNRYSLVNGGRIIPAQRSFTKLEKEDSDGNRSVIYNVERAFLTSQAAKLLLFAAFVGVLVLMIVHASKNTGDGSLC